MNGGIMYCEKCGKQLPDDAIFCCYCGQVVKDQYRQKVKIQVCNIRTRSKSSLFGGTVSWVEVEWDGKIQLQSAKVETMKIIDSWKHIQSNLLQAGWDPVSYNEAGLIVTLRRTVNE